MYIICEITETFDSGGGPETITREMKLANWIDLIAHLIAELSDGRAFPDKIEIVME